MSAIQQKLQECGALVPLSELLSTSEHDSISYCDGTTASSTWIGIIFDEDDDNSEIDDDISHDDAYYGNDSGYDYFSTKKESCMEDESLVELIDIDDDSLAYSAASSKHRRKRKTKKTRENAQQNQTQQLQHQHRLLNTTPEMESIKETVNELLNGGSDIVELMEHVNIDDVNKNYCNDTTNMTIDRSSIEQIHACRTEQTETETTSTNMVSSSTPLQPQLVSNSQSSEHQQQQQSRLAKQQKLVNKKSSGANSKWWRKNKSNRRTVSRATSNGSLRSNIPESNNRLQLLLCSSGGTMTGKKESMMYRAQTIDTLRQAYLATESEAFVPDGEQNQDDPLKTDGSAYVHSKAALTKSQNRIAYTSENALAANVKNVTPTVKVINDDTTVSSTMTASSSSCMQEPTQSKKKKRSQPQYYEDISIHTTVKEEDDNYVVKEVKSNSHPYVKVEF